MFKSTIFSVSVALLAASAFATNVCGPGEEICNISIDNGRNRFRQCYNVHDQVCVNNLVCPNDHNKRCGDSCYNDGLSYCHFINENLSILCPMATPHLCQSSCYSDEFYNCINYELVPKKEAHERLARELDEANFREVDAEADPNIVGRATATPANIPSAIPSYEV